MTREEAIEIVQSATVWTDKERDALSMLIPELAESEDEKIRKKMIEHFKSKTKDTWCNMPVKSILAWLEKQKDLDKMIVVSPEVWDNAISDAFENEKKEGEKQKEQKPAEWQKEQKPAEWSEEDEKDMAHIIRILDDCYVYGTHDLSKTDHENLVNKLKSLRPSWKPSEEHLSALLAVFNDPNNIGSQTCQLALTDLYEQLKKL